MPRTARRIVVLAALAAALPAGTASAEVPTDQVSIPFSKPPVVTTPLPPSAAQTTAKGSSAVVSLGKLGRVE